MARADENGKGVQAVLGYLLDRMVPAKEIFMALGIARSTYNVREKDDNYPNAEEARLLAESFGLNPVDIMVRFGLVKMEHVEAMCSTRSKRVPKLSEMPRNSSVSAL